MYVVGSYPISFMLRPDYPFNHLKGHVCSGHGIHHSQATEKEKAAFLALLSGALLYIFSLVYWSATTSRFLKGFSPKGTGAMMNGKFR